MKINTEDLIFDLIENIRLNMDSVKKLKNLSNDELNYRESQSSWTILECIEHLNLYGDFYIPVIRECVKEQKNEPTKVFKSGLLGNYFVKSMHPKERQNKMKTFTNMNPLNRSLDKQVIDRFLNQQKEYLELVHNSRQVNLNKAKTALSISKIIKMKLGDTFRFINAHNNRHIIQIKNIMKKYSFE